MDSLGTAQTEFRWVTAATGIIGLPLIVALIVWMGARYARALRVAQDREVRLVEANRVNERRNAQFRGLYQVVSEVTDTLSLKYVVDTTVQQVRRLVDAELVVLRILDGSRLHAQGTEGEIAGQVTVIEDVELGDGTVGRAAKRGKVLRTSTLTDEAVLTGGDVQADDVSGVVVPLIVGARVVGTVSCWTRREDAFEDDLQVLEMMASQVATAIAAADMHEESDRSAHVDVLTELPNRRQFVHDVRTKYDIAVQSGQLLTLAMVDIDHFKRFNDAHGHQAGDVALQRVARLLAAGVRSEDRVYRYGGEEFVIVFDALGIREAADVCERLCQLVARDVMPGGQEGEVTISVGLATAPAMARSFDELLAAADDALYASKDRGRNRLTLAPSSGDAPGDMSFGARRIGHPWNPTVDAGETLPADRSA